MKINTILPDKHKYLQMIGAIAQVPKRLYIIGTLPLVRIPTVAIVGTRRPTQYGKQVTFDLAYKLAQRGIVVVSGLAYGIDAAAHAGALEGGGRTIAIMAHGLDAVYPKGNRTLAEKIIAYRGALISEYPENTPVMKHQFLARNRLVSAVADAVIVTEAGQRSGTLSTITHALEQGKEVFAVPGAITSPQSVGPNNLLKQGAHPVTSVDDVLAVIAPHLITTPQMAPTGGTPEETLILALLHQGISHGEALQTAAALDAPVFFQTMTVLEIDGRIRALGANNWALSS